MLEFSVYSVISPEGCASILWKDQGKVDQAAAQMKMTAEDLKSLGVVDEVPTEPRRSALQPRWRRRDRRRSGGSSLGELASGRAREPARFALRRYRALALRRARLTPGAYRRPAVSSPATVVT